MKLFFADGILETNNYFTKTENLKKYRLKEFFSLIDCLESGKFKRIQTFKRLKIMSELGELLDIQKLSQKKTENLKHILYAYESFVKYPLEINISEPTFTKNEKVKKYAHINIYLFMFMPYKITEHWNEPEYDIWNPLSKEIWNCFEWNREMPNMPSISSGGSSHFNFDKKFNKDIKSKEDWNKMKQYIFKKLESMEYPYKVC